MLNAGALLAADMLHLLLGFHNTSHSASAAAPCHFGIQVVKKEEIDLPTSPTAKMIFTPKYAHHPPPSSLSRTHTYSLSLTHTHTISLPPSQSMQITPPLSSLAHTHILSLSLVVLG